MAQPSFDMMWQAFPDHLKYPSLRDLHTYIGGTLVRNIDSPGFGEKGNTCAARMSRENDHDDYRLQADDPATEKVEATTKGMILWPL